MMRAFVALDLPDEITAAVRRLQAGLTVGRVMAEDTLHLTLAFLGDVADPLARDVAEALSALRLPQVAVQISGLDVFGGRRPSVLVALAKGDGLDRLHDKVVRAVREAGHDLPGERFRPHVTLARFPRVFPPKDQQRLGEFLALNGTFALPPAPALAVTLYRSHLRDDGAIHEPLASFPLSG